MGLQLRFRGTQEKHAMMREQIKKLMLGNGLAQLLQFGSILILSRIYQPSDFGLLAQVQSIAMIASIIITLQLHLTIPLAKSNDHAQEKVQLIQVLSISIFSLALIPAIWNGESALFALLLSLSLGLTNTYTGYLVYSGNFGKMSFFYVARALLIIVMQVGFANAGFNNGLIIATLTGEALSAIYLGLRTTYGANRIKWQITNLKLFIFNNKPFSLYGTIQEIISVSAFYSPLLIFNFKFGDEIGGQYAMANRLVWAPIVLISSSLAQVLYHSLGKKRPTTNSEILALLPDRKIIILAIAAVVITLPMTDIFHMILGNKWLLASELIPLQLFWGLFFLASTPFRVAARVMLLQKQQLIIDVCMIVTTCLLFYALPFPPKSLMVILLVIVLVQHSSIIALVFSKVRQN
jgi:O-antigen/teichoic acid export membrane protein